MLAIAFLHFSRLCYWFSPYIFKHPLLLSLYAAYTCLMSGIFLLALSYFPNAIAFKDALHLITIGAMGLMILSMMTRVSLGHTNRKIISNNRMNIAFLLLMISALVRSFGVNLLNIDIVISWKISAFLWMASFALFVFQFASVLCGPKSL